MGLLETASPELIAEAKRLGWRKGILEFKYRNTQRFIKKRWLEAKQTCRKFYIETTRRMGKSSFLLMLFAGECLTEANRKCGFFAPVKEGLLDYIEPLIVKVFDDCPEDVLPFFDKQRFMLRFKNGSTIIFRGSNNQQHRIRRGQEFHLVGVDEGRDVDNLGELIETVVFPSLFSADGHLIISSTPADTTSHPLYWYRAQAKVGGWLVEIPMSLATKMDPQTYTADRIVEWKEETLKAPDGQETWDREYECKWVVNRRRMAVPEWNAQYVVPRTKDPFYQFYDHYIGLDWGYRDYTALTFATWDFRKARLITEGELTFSGVEVRSDFIAEQVRAQWFKLWGNAEVYRMVSDSADPILINEINKYDGMSFVPVPKLNSLEAMLNEYRVLVSQGKVLIAPECPMTIQSHETAVWNDQRTRLDKDVLAHHFDHLMANVYLTRMLDRDHNPIPADFAVDGVRVINMGFEGKKAQGQTAQALEEAFGNRRTR